MVQHSGRESWSSRLLQRQIQFEECWADCYTTPDSSLEAADYELCNLNIESP